MINIDKNRRRILKLARALPGIAMFGVGGSIALTGGAALAANRTNDVSDVIDVVNAYIDGSRESNIEKLTPLFHKDCVMSGYLGPDLLVGSVEPFFDVLAANKLGDDFSAEIANVFVLGNTAKATTFEDNFLGMSFVNEFHLVKENGNWLFVSKMFHHD